MKSNDSTSRRARQPRRRRLSGAELGEHLRRKQAEKTASRVRRSRRRAR